MKVFNDGTFIFRKLRNLSLLIFLMVNIMSLPVLMTSDDPNFDKIELKKDIEGERENSEKEISDNLEIDDFRHFSSNIDKALLYQMTEISKSSSRSKLDHCLNIDTPPPKVRT